MSRIKGESKGLRSQADSTCNSIAAPQRLKQRVEKQSLKTGIDEA